MAEDTNMIGLQINTEDFKKQSRQTIEIIRQLRNELQTITDPMLTKSVDYLYRRSEQKTNIFRKKTKLNAEYGQRSTEIDATHLIDLSKVFASARDVLVNAMSNSLKKSANITDLPVKDIKYIKEKADDFIGGFFRKFNEDFTNSFYAITDQNQRKAIVAKNFSNYFRQNKGMIEDQNLTHISSKMLASEIFNMEAAPDDIIRFKTAVKNLGPEIAKVTTAQEQLNSVFSSATWGEKQKAQADQYIRALSASIAEGKLAVENLKEYVKQIDKTGKAPVAKEPSQAIKGYDKRVAKIEEYKKAMEALQALYKETEVKLDSINKSLAQKTSKGFNIPVSTEDILDLNRRSDLVEKELISLSTKVGRATTKYVRALEKLKEDEARALDPKYDIIKRNAEDIKNIMGLRKLQAENVASQIPIASLLAKTGIKDTRVQEQLEKEIQKSLPDFVNAMGGSLQNIDQAARRSSKQFKDLWLTAITSTISELDDSGKAFYNTFRTSIDTAQSYFAKQGQVLGTKILPEGAASIHPQVAKLTTELGELALAHGVSESQLTKWYNNLKEGKAVTTDATKVVGKLQEILKVDTNTAVQSWTTGFVSSIGNISTLSNTAQDNISRLSKELERTASSGSLSYGRLATVFNVDLLKGINSASNELKELEGKQAYKAQQPAALAKADQLRIEESQINAMLKQSEAIRNIIGAPLVSGDQLQGLFPTPSEGNQKGLNLFRQRLIEISEALNTLYSTGKVKPEFLQNVTTEFQKLKSLDSSKQFESLGKIEDKDVRKFTGELLNLNQSLNDSTKYVERYREAKQILGGKYGDYSQLGSDVSNLVTKTINLNNAEFKSILTFKEATSASVEYNNALDQLSQTQRKLEVLGKKSKFQDFKKNLRSQALEANFSDSQMGLLNSSLEKFQNILVSSGSALKQFNQSYGKISDLDLLKSVFPESYGPVNLMSNMFQTKEVENKIRRYRDSQKDLGAFSDIDPKSAANYEKSLNLIIRAASHSDIAGSKISKAWDQFQQGVPITETLGKNLQSITSAFIQIKLASGGYAKETTNALDLVQKRYDQLGKLSITPLDYSKATGSLLKIQNQILSAQTDPERLKELTSYLQKDISSTPLAGEASFNLKSFAAELDKVNNITRTGELTTRLREFFTLDPNNINTQLNLLNKLSVELLRVNAALDISKIANLESLYNVAGENNVAKGLIDKLLQPTSATQMQQTADLLRLNFKKMLGSVYEGITFTDEQQAQLLKLNDQFVKEVSTYNPRELIKFQTELAKGLLPKLSDFDFTGQARAIIQKMYTTFEDAYATTKGYTRSDYIVRMLTDNIELDQQDAMRIQQLLGQANKLIIKSPGLSRYSDDVFSRGAKVVIEDANNLTPALTNAIRLLDTYDTKINSILATAKFRNIAIEPANIAGLSPLEDPKISNYAKQIEKMITDRKISPDTVEDVWKKHKEGMLANSKAAKELDPQLHGLLYAYNKIGDEIDKFVKRGGYVEPPESIDAYIRKVFNLKNLFAMFAISMMYRTLYTVLGAFRKGVQEAIKFEAAIAEIGTITLKSSLGVARLTEELQKLSFQFGTNPLEQTEGYYQIISNQLANAKDATGVLEQFNKLAIVGLSDIGTAVEVASTFMKAYSMNVRDAEHATALLFKVVEYGKVRLKEMKDKVGDSAVQAAELGVKAEELAALWEMLTVRGINFAKANTQIRGIMMRIYKPADELVEIFQRLGYATPAAAVEVRGLQWALEEIYKYTKGDSKKLVDLFPNIRGIMGAIVAIKGGAKEFARYVKMNIDESKNLEEQFKLMKDTGQFTLKQLSSATQNAFTNLGQVFLELLKPSNPLGQALLHVAEFMNLLAKLFSQIRQSFAALEYIPKIAAMASVSMTSVGAGILAFKSPAIILGQKLSWLGKMFGSFGMGVGSLITKLTSSTLLLFLGRVTMVFTALMAIFYAAKNLYGSVDKYLNSDLKIFEAARKATEAYQKAFEGWIGALRTYSDEMKNNIVQSTASITSAMFSTLKKNVERAVLRFDPLLNRESYDRLSGEIIDDSEGKLKTIEALAKKATSIVKDSMQKMHDAITETDKKIEEIQMKTMPKSGQVAFLEDKIAYLRQLSIRAAEQGNKEEFDIIRKELDEAFGKVQELKFELSPPIFNDLAELDNKIIELRNKLQYEPNSKKRSEYKKELRQAEKDYKKLARVLDRNPQLANEYNNAQDSYRNKLDEELYLRDLMNDKLMKTRDAIQAIDNVMQKVNTSFTEMDALITEILQKLSDATTRPEKQKVLSEGIIRLNQQMQGFLSSYRDLGNSLPYIPNEMLQGEQQILQKYFDTFETLRKENLKEVTEYTKEIQEAFKNMDNKDIPQFYDLVNKMNTEVFGPDELQRLIQLQYKSTKLTGEKLAKEQELLKTVREIVTEQENLNKTGQELPEDRKKELYETQQKILALYAPKGADTTELEKAYNKYIAKLQQVMELEQKIKLNRRKAIAPSESDKSRLVNLKEAAEKLRLEYQAKYQSTYFQNDEIQKLEKIKKLEEEIKQAKKENRNTTSLENRLFLEKSGNTENKNQYVSNEVMINLLKQEIENYKKQLDINNPNTFYLKDEIAKAEAKIKELNAVNTDLMLQTKSPNIEKANEEIKKGLELKNPEDALTNLIIKQQEQVEATLSQESELINTGNSLLDSILNVTRDIFREISGEAVKNYIKDVGEYWTHGGTLPSSGPLKEGPGDYFSRLWQKWDDARRNSKARIKKDNEINVEKNTIVPYSKNQNNITPTNPITRPNVAGPKTTSDTNVNVNVNVTGGPMTDQQARDLSNNLGRQVRRGLSSNWANA